MKQNNNKLKENGTALNINASELLDMDINEVISLENQRLNNIGEGNR